MLQRARLRCWHAFSMNGLAINVQRVSSSWPRRATGTGVNQSTLGISPNTCSRLYTDSTDSLDSTARPLLNNEDAQIRNWCVLYWTTCTHPWRCSGLVFMPAMMLAKLTMVSLIFLINGFEFSRFARSQNRKKSTTSLSPTPLRHLHL